MKENPTMHLCTNPHLESTKRHEKWAKIERIRGKPIKNKYNNTINAKTINKKSHQTNNSKKINKKSIIFKLFFVCSSAVSSSFRFVVFFVFKARRPIHVPLGTKVWVGALLHHWSSSWLDFLGALMMIRGKHVHPRKLTWNLKRMVSKRNLLLQGSIFRFHVSFRGCTLKMNEYLRWFFLNPLFFF